MPSPKVPAHRSRRNRTGRSARLVRAGWSFTTDRKYRNKVLSFVEQHLSAGDPEATADEAVPTSLDPLPVERVYLIGGCELTGIKHYLERRGAVTYHTFDHQRPVDPLIEVGDADAHLWSFRPDAVVISQAQLATGLFHKLQWRGFEVTRDELLADVDALVGSLGEAIRQLRASEHCPVVIVGHNLAHRPSLGVLQQQITPDSFSLAELVAHYRLALYQLGRSYPDTYIVDPQVVFERIGLDQTSTVKDELLGEHLLAPGSLALAAAVVTVLTAVQQPRPVKCIVLDLDNTMWRGILREDGADGLYVYRHLARAVRYLMARGILVAVVSKNDPEEEALLHGLLGADLVDQLVAVRLNWQSKSDNIRELAQDLNLGLDSFAFFDDNPRERAEVADALPEVRIFTENDILRALELPDFQAGPNLTKSSAKRGESYRREEQRRASSTTSDPEAFLASLELQLSLRRAGPADVGRIAELLGRTNQLNATLQRRDAADVQAHLANGPQRAAVVAELSDRFGDYGLIGVALFADESTTRTIDELAFSCRAMGRKVEDALLVWLSTDARTAGAVALEIAVTITSRNNEIVRILEANGFDPLDRESGGEGSVVHYRHEVTEPGAPAYPSALTVTVT